MCCDCNDIDIITSDPGYNGWSPVYANIEETCTTNDVVIQQLISWIGGTGTKPSYNGNIMTDTWLAANPLYLGDTGWVDTTCEATNILGTNGTNGSNGSNGATGEAGNDGCNPDITINVTAGSEEIVCTVTPSVTGCAPVFDINIPDGAFTNDTVVDTITSSTAFTNAVDAAVDALINPTPTRISPLDISTGTGDELKYTLMSGAVGTITLTTTDSWLTHYQIGNFMTVNFKIKFTVSGGGYGPIVLEIKLPNSKTVVNDDYSNAISSYKIGSSSNRYPVISTNYHTSSSYIRIAENADLAYIPVISGDVIIYMGQFTFLVN